MQTLILNKIILPKIPGIVIGPMAVTDYLISPNPHHHRIKFEGTNRLINFSAI